MSKTQSKAAPKGAAAGGVEKSAAKKAEAGSPAAPAEDGRGERRSPGATDRAPLLILAEGSDLGPRGKIVFVSADQAATAIKSKAGRKPTPKEIALAG